jgi:hypothetical protein
VYDHRSLHQRGICSPVVGALVLVVLVVHGILERQRWRLTGGSRLPLTDGAQQQQLSDP